ncbi:MAG: 4Fe-4S dicluster domain-containing protein [Moorellaceae bacterium]
MNVIKVDLEKCTGCKTCYKACFVDVIRWDDSNKRPVIAYPEDCVECNYCEISCPEEAISVIVDYSKPWPNVYE